MSKILLMILTLLLAVPLSGCSDYRGLDELTIVAGMAIDLDENDPEAYKIAFEIVDMTSAASDGPTGSKLLETTGKTITEAVFNANRKLHRNMYFGNSEIVVISREIAERKGLNLIVDPLLRDSEIRDNLYILVSNEKTAKEIIEPGDQVVSFYLSKNIAENDFSANSTKPYELYAIHSMLKEQTTSLALPALRITDREKKEISLDGMALFSGSKLVGSLNSSDTPYYLLASAKLAGGSFLVSQQPEEETKRYAALADRSSSAKHDYRYEDGRFVFRLNVEMIAAAIEFSQGWGDLTGDLIRQLESDAGSTLSKEVTRVLLSVQREHGVDIVGFADRIRDQDAALWSSVREHWPDYVKNAEIIVECKVLINDTGLIRQY
jgi:spore germination protein KC